MPSFDIVIPCYNYGRFLPDCVRSVLSQPVDLRVLIIDDTSQDETEEVGRSLARDDARVTFRRHSANRGHIETYNEGIAWADSDFFTILSADDLMMPGALPRARSAFSRAADALMVYGRALYFNDGLPTDRVLDGSLPARVRSYNPADGHADGTAANVPAKVLEGQLRALPPVFETTGFYLENAAYNNVHACSVVTRTEAQKRLGGYRMDLPHAGDWEMWLRFAAHGRVCFIPQFQVAPRTHAVNMSSSYYADMSADIMQRAQVLDVIEASCGHLLAKGLLDRMRRSLAISAMRAAGGPMSCGDKAAGDHLLSIAKQIDPAIGSSMVWKVFMLTRMAGPVALNKVPPRLRRVALKAMRLA